MDCFLTLASIYDMCEITILEATICQESLLTASFIKQQDIEDGESVMTAEYRPVEYGKGYDVVNHPDKFQLYIDGKEVEE